MAWLRPRRRYRPKGSGSWCEHRARRCAAASKPSDHSVDLPAPCSTCAIGSSAEADRGGSDAAASAGQNGNPVRREIMHSIACPIHVRRVSRTAPGSDADTDRNFAPLDSRIYRVRYTRTGLRPIPQHVPYRTINMALSCLAAGAARSRGTRPVAPSATGLRGNERSPAEAGL